MTKRDKQGALALTPVFLETPGDLEILQSALGAKGISMPLIDFYRKNGAKSGKRSGIVVLVPENCLELIPETAVVGKFEDSTTKETPLKKNPGFYFIQVLGRLRKHIIDVKTKGEMFASEPVEPTLESIAGLTRDLAVQGVQIELAYVDWENTKQKGKGRRGRKPSILMLAIQNPAILRHLAKDWQESRIETLAPARVFAFLKKMV